MNVPINSLCDLHNLVTKLNKKNNITNIEQLPNKVISTPSLINSLHIGEISGKLPSNIINSTIYNINNKNIGYTPTLGYYSLRNLIATDLNKRKGFNILPDNIIITNGSKQGLFYAIKSLIKYGDEVIVHKPFWNSYKKLVEIEGGKIITIPLEKNGNLNIDIIKTYINSKTKIIIICNPHNPTGSIPEINSIKNLLSLVNGKDIYIISDEIYERIDFYNKHKSLAFIAKKYNYKCNILTIGGFSKSHMMTGFRIGYLIANQNIIKKASILQQNICTCVSSLSQYVAIDVLKDTESEKKIIELNNCLKSRLIILKNIFKTYPLWDSKGAFYIFVDIKNKLKKSENDKDLCKKLLNLGVAVAPGSLFGLPNYIRISYACSEEIFNNSIPILKKFFL